MVIVLGTNYKYSPVELRERLSFSKRRLKEALNLLKEREVIKGAVILSTCNRVEIYVSTEEKEKATLEVKDFISQYHEVEKEEFFPYFYRYTDKEAVRHLLSVVCGLDSLILGEIQILGQVKSSFLEAEAVGFVDNFLRDIFYSAFGVVEKIHRETKISKGKVSVGSVAIDFIKEKSGSLKGRCILIIGVGKVTELVLKYLKKEEPHVVFISNRTFEKAKNLASQIGAEVVRFDDLKRFLKEADIIITATASPHFIIKKSTFKEAIRHRILIIDLALPRDVDPQIKEIENVDLFCLEDLESVIKKNIKKKAVEAQRAIAIIDKEAESLWCKITEWEQELALLL